MNISISAHTVIERAAGNHECGELADHIADRLDGPMLTLLVDAVDVAAASDPRFAALSISIASALAEYDRTRNLSGPPVDLLARIRSAITPGSGSIEDASVRRRAEVERWASSWSPAATTATQPRDISRSRWADLTEQERVAWAPASATDVLAASCYQRAVERAAQEPESIWMGASSSAEWAASIDRDPGTHQVPVLPTVRRLVDGIDR